jgi:hypothetical protein
MLSTAEIHLRYGTYREWPLLPPMGQLAFSFLPSAGVLISQSGGCANRRGVLSVNVKGWEDSLLSAISTSMRGVNSQSAPA